MVLVGHIHGRFQPFHNKHADYAEWAAKQCDHLIIGITNADPSHVTKESSEPKRHKLKHNPFKYHERHKMIRKYVDGAPFDNPVSIMPFPINIPEYWDEYAPRDAVHFVRTLEEWHDTKVNRFKSEDREVVTQQVPRVLSGEDIRDNMTENGEWRSDVPDPVADVIDDINGVQRVTEIYENEQE